MRRALKLLSDAGQARYGADGLPRNIWSMSSRIDALTPGPARALTEIERAIRNAPPPTGHRLLNETRYEFFEEQRHIEHE